MAFKPYCEQCRTWHTEAEGHLPPPKIFTEEQEQRFRAQDALYAETMKTP